MRSLLTTVTTDFGRVSMHGVREELVRSQAEALKLPVEVVRIRHGADNLEYETRLKASLHDWPERGVSCVAFGDIFLEDIRRYRERLLSEVGISCAFPIWGRGTGELAASFIALGFRALVCTVDPKALGKGFCGREFDTSFLSDLPKGVDPCGENGEFHTFVYGGPIFEREIEVKKGEVVRRDGFYFCDIIPV